jgi:NosR/NirI family nitrous oxide reductase transcriptional regulator
MPTLAEPPARAHPPGRIVLAVLLFAALCCGPALAQEYEYERPVDVAPTDETIGEGYVAPEVQRPLPRAAVWHVFDVVLLGAALALGAWLALRRRRRAGLVALTIACLAYFGFYREGCICPIGSIQNVAVALVDPAYAVPYFVIATFMLPLVAALFFGRVFCSGVCALGAIQELMVLKPVEVPARLDRALGYLKWVYLGLAVVFAVLPAVHRDFIICRFDPFVGLFRFTGQAWLLLVGGGFLVAGIFIGRPYCRWLCPYGALLSVFSRYAWRSFSITPDRELDCGLCNDACPYGAIEKRRAVRTACFACGRCYRSCPVEHAGRGELTAPAGAGAAPPVQ